MSRSYRNDDALDERGLLKDGRSVRVSMQMRDSLERTCKPMISNGTGNPLSLNRPGYRVRANDVAARDAREAALRDRDEEMRNAYKNTQRDADTGEGSGDFIAQHEGDLCTINGSPGHIDSDGRCVPDNPRISGKGNTASDAKKRALADYDLELSQAWKEGK